MEEIKMEKVELLKIINDAKEKLGGRLVPGDLNFRGGRTQYKGKYQEAFEKFLSENKQYQAVSNFVLDPNNHGIAEVDYYEMVVIGHFCESVEYQKLKYKKRLIDALERTTEIPVGNTNYLDATLLQRLGGIGGAGSWFENMTEEQLLETLTSTDSELTEFRPEGAMEGCTYYKMNLPGKNGIVDILDLPKDSPLYLTISHAGTGRLDVVTTAKVPAKDELETTIILGEEEGIGEVMFTLHPGLPVTPSKLTIEGLKKQFPNLTEMIEKRSQELTANGQDRESIVLQINPKMAKELGFDKAKIASEEYAHKLGNLAIDGRVKDEWEI